jgi:hypothetical protein
MMTTQVNNTLISGLQRTLAMRLPGHPPADAVDGMFQAWIAAFDALPIAWDDERDVPRLEQAFALLWAQAERWPIPKMLIACLPPAPPPPMLDAPKKVWTPEEIARNKKRLAEMMGMLADKMVERKQFLDEEGKNHDTAN